LEAKKSEKVQVDNENQQVDDEEQVSIVIRAINEKLCSSNQENQSIENNMRKSSDSSSSHSSSLVSMIRKRFSVIKKRSKSNLPPCLNPHVKVESKWKVNFPPRVTLTSSNHICNLSSKFQPADSSTNSPRKNSSQTFEKILHDNKDSLNQCKQNSKPTNSIRKLNNADYVRIVMNRDQLVEFRKAALKIFENNKQVF
jgi:hypothetical protein